MLNFSEWCQFGIMKVLFMSLEYSEKSKITNAVNLHLGLISYSTVFKVYRRRD